MEITNQQDTKITELRNDPVALSPSFRLYERIGMALAAIVLTSVIVTAAVLTPDPSGSGTHQQLGLPPCTIKFFFGIPCPACGMTTSWALIFKGYVVEALHANVGGVLFAFVAVVSVIKLGIYAIWNDRTSVPRYVSFLVWSLTTALVTASTQWLIRLY